MNKAITDGIVFQPQPFAAGLSIWSSGDGTPGSDTYAQSGSGVFVAADQDFGGCLEVLKQDATTLVRYMGQTPVLAGCFLRVTAKVKAIAGPMPAVAVSGWAGATGGAAVAGLVTAGPSKQLTSYGEVVEVAAIVSTSAQSGVDLVWLGADYGHFGITLSGPSGGLVRVDDIVIEDISAAFWGTKSQMIDVRDYGAIGDGLTDESNAFDAADSAANGRAIFVPEGDYLIGRNLTLQSELRCHGRIVQPQNYRLILQNRFNYDSYFEAFKDEELAFKKAYQALINFADHESLDLCGRRVLLNEPVDMQACDPTKARFETRRVIRNGQFQPAEGAAWDTEVVVLQASYDPGSPLVLTGIVNAASLRAGSLVTGNGVGREVYVTSVDVATATAVLSQPLYGAAPSQSYTFTRFKYLLDFSGYEKLSQFVLDDIEFQGLGIASGIMLAPDGLTFHLRDCFINNPKDRGLTSIGAGCQGMMIDRCQFISAEEHLPVSARQSIGFNTNANDVKLRNTRASKFHHFGVLAGTGNVISGNHWFQGDSEPSGVRHAGLVFTFPNPQSTITGNYCDNNFIEWTNEHDATPDFFSQFSFGGMTINGNTFLTNDVADWVGFLVIKPFGAGHFINGLSVCGNVFRALNGVIDRVEHVDSSFAPLDLSRTVNCAFAQNVFHNVAKPVANPLTVTHTQATAATTWTVKTEAQLPFSGRALRVDAVANASALRNGSNAVVSVVPWVEAAQGSGGDQVRLHWTTAVSGTVNCQISMDSKSL